MKKKSRIRGKVVKISSPFGVMTHKTERTAVSILMHWMREIIERENIDLGFPDVETSGEDRKSPDTVIYESRRSQNIICIIEAKPPYFDVFDEKELKEPGRNKANSRKARYFCLTNFKKLIWYETQKVNEMKPEEEQILEQYNLSEIEDLNEIEQVRYSEPIKRTLKDFLIKLYSVYYGKESEPRLAIDEFLVFRIQEKIRVLSTYYKRIIDDKCHKEPEFSKKLINWFTEQEWGFSWQEEDFYKASRQTAYLLVNKILFYNLLQAKRPKELDPLEIPDGLTKGSILQKTLQAYFNEVLKIDYETIYTADFIDTIAFPEAKEVVKEIKELIKVLKRYDFSKLGYDIIGRIFERLIPQDERHNLGQYFTNPDIVDLILRFCLQHEDDKILDPACGAGTFLVRSYQHKKLMNCRLEHERILETLWGIDIAKFPAHLSTINLAINDLGVDKNYPNIIHEDFFKLLITPEGFEPPENWRKTRVVTLGRENRKITYPRWFDVIVGNPPYTRHEEISETGVDKDKLIEDALKDIKGNKIADISQRAGIYAYFFVHGTKLLKESGYFGFIVSNAWLDVAYGKGIQEFFLNNYKIVAIIESKVERWFEDADINTCIIILQKCGERSEREKNLVRFVYLKKPLRYFIPPAQDIWEKQIKRIDAIDKLKNTILGHNEFYENEELRIFPKTQKELWEEGFDNKERKYLGSKWGKYIKAPEIFFKILEKGKGKLVPLKDVAEVRFGIKTGANKFFYLTEEEIKKKGIEKEFWMHKDKKGNWIPNYVIKSPRECKSIVVAPEDLKYRVLLIHKYKDELRNSNVLKYIEQGEKQGFHKRRTCASRERWYDLGKWCPFEVLFTMYFQQSYKYHLNPFRCFVDHTMYECDSGNTKINKILILFFNSSLAFLYPDILGRGYGGGGAPTGFMVYEVERLPVMNPLNLSPGNRKKLLQLFKKFTTRKWDTIFEEIGANSPENVSLDKVKPDRRELDKIIMGEILGLTEDEQLEVYRTVVDLVKSRIEKAKSVKKKNIKEGIDIDILRNTIIRKIKEKNENYR